MLTFNPYLGFPTYSEPTWKRYRIL